MFVPTSIDCFCLFTIQLNFILRCPVFNVRMTVRCGFQQSMDVFGLGAVVELRVVNVEVVLQVVTVDDGGQRGSMESEENGPCHNT